MNYQIVIAPELSISTEDFIATWNDSPKCRAVAAARLDAPAHRSYEPLTASVVLIGLVSGIATNALYDLIKHVLIKKGVSKRVEITQIEQPDDKRIIIIKMIKE
jgi:hypothetical protein